jgi:hypothetical protein
MWHQTVMKQSGLVVTKGTTDEGAPVAEAEHIVAEEENIDEEEDYSILILTKPSVGVLGPTAHPGLPFEVLFGVGWCYRM